MKIVGASFLVLAYLSAVAATYYQTGGNLAATGYVSATLAAVVGGLFWKS